MPVVADAGQGDRDPRGGGAVGASYRATDGDHAAFGASLIDGEALSPDVCQVLAQLLHVRTLAWSLGVAILGVQDVELLVGELREQDQSPGDLVGREHHSLAVADAQ